MAPTAHPPKVETFDAGYGETTEDIEPTAEELAAIDAE